MVTIKHKVTIKTKTAQEETPVAVEAPKNVTIKKKTPEVPETPKKPQIPPTPPTPDGGDNGGNTGGSKTWMWIVAIVIAAIIAFLCFKNCGNKEEATGADEGGVPATEQVDSTQNRETQEASTGEESNAQEENAGSDETDQTSNNPYGAKAESNNDGSEASEVQPEKKNDAPEVPAKQENKKLTTSPSAQVSGDLEENARQVIRGVFGNGQERKDKLGAAYAEIQGKVNEMYRQGLVR